MGGWQFRKDIDRQDESLLDLTDEEYEEYERNVAPITPVQTNPEPFINFGRYRGKSFRDVARDKPSYIMYILKGDFLKSDVRQFIMDNIIDRMKIGFGKYANLTMREIAIEHPEYLLWLGNQDGNEWMKRYAYKFGSVAYD